MEIVVLLIIVGALAWWLLVALTKSKGKPQGPPRATARDFWAPTRTQPPEAAKGQPHAGPVGTIDHLSYSMLEAFDQCRKRFWYRYVAKVEPDFVTIEAFAGQVSHKVLEWMYMRKAADAPLTWPAVSRKLTDTWTSEYRSGAVRVIRPERGVQSYQSAARESLKTFYYQTFLQDRSETIGVEREIKLDIGGVPYVGFVDRIARDGPVTRIIDYKTGRSNRQPRLGNLQLEGYGVAIMRELGVASVLLVKHSVANGRIASTLFSFTLQERVLKTLQWHLDRIVATHEFEARPSPLCPWCPYSGKCAEFRA